MLCRVIVRWVPVPALLLTCFSVAGGGTACGPARPLLPDVQDVGSSVDEKNHTDEQESRALRLGLEILPECSKRGNHGSNSKRPEIRKKKNTRFDEKRTRYRVKAAGDQIFFDQILRFPKNKELFLVWPDDSLDSKIVRATVTHRVLDGQNQWIEGVGPEFAHRDSSHHRWYVSLSRLVRHFPSYRNIGVTEADTQVVILILTLEDHTEIEIGVRFRASKQIKRKRRKAYGSAI